jgi:hypothetical protein
MRRLNWLWIGAAALGACFVSRRAEAANPACNTLPNPIYVEAGDTQEPLLKTIGRGLRNSSQPMTIIYNTTGSCSLIQDMYTSNPLKVNLKYVPSTAENATWDPSQPSLQCTNTSQAIDVAISAVFVQACTAQSPPPPIGLITGPIQGYGFLVPKASTQTAITAEEAYFAFGFGAQGGATPWIDETYFQIRPATKSTLVSLANTIRLDPTKWRGHPWDKSTDLLSYVATSPAPEATIGIIGAEVYDQNRSKTSILAFKAYQQRYAYYPDSTSTSFDKQNLRDGHYVPWSPTVYIAPVDANNVPTNANAKRLMSLVLGSGPSDDVDGLSGVVSVGLIPDCAMKVSRTVDGGDLSLYTPAHPCGCFYESKVPNASGAPAGCSACTTDATCGTGKCNHGYCEVQ